jgi:hypothetical protein
MGSRNWTVSTRKIASQGELKSLLLRLMLVNNDIAILPERRMTA